MSVVRFMSSVFLVALLCSCGASPDSRSAVIGFDKSDASVGNTVRGSPEVLHSFTLPANTFTESGDKFRFSYHGDIGPGADGYFGVRFDGRDMAIAGPLHDDDGVSWQIDGDVMRVDSSTVEWHVVVSLQRYSELGNGESNPVNEEISPVAFDEDLDLQLVVMSDQAPAVTLVRGGATGRFIPAVP